MRTRTIPSLRLSEVPPLPISGLSGYKTKRSPYYTATSRERRAKAQHLLWVLQHKKLPASAVEALWRDYGPELADLTSGASRVAQPGA